MGMGRYVKITGQIGQGRYAARHELSGETFFPSVMRPYRDIFSPYGKKTPGEWCPFLLENDNRGNYFCAVHETLPSFCRDFKCCLYRVYNLENNCMGEVRGRRNLVSDDERLNKIWNDEVLSLSSEDEFLWKKNMLDVLEKEGYLIEAYD